MNEIKIWHVANAGVIIEIGELHIGVDILCDQIVPFRRTPKEVEDQVMDPALCPQLDYVIITHEHGDHYSKHKMTEFLLLHPQAKVISNEAVVSDLQGILDETRLITVHAGENSVVEIQDKDVQLKIFDSTHMGAEYKNTVNLCTILSWKGKKILIPGDAEPRELLNGNRLNAQKLDFLIVPFPYITLISVRKLVKDKIQPEQLLVIHLPAEEHDKGEWIPRSKEIYQKEAGNFPKTTFGDQMGESYRWVWSSLI